MKNCNLYENKTDTWTKLKFEEMVDSELLSRKQTIISSLVNLSQCTLYFNSYYRIVTLSLTVCYIYVIGFNGLLVT